MQPHVVKQEPTDSSPRATLAPLSIPDISSTTLAAVQETSESVASSPSLSSALSPADSDVAPHAPPATGAPKPQNPIIRRAISCSALAGPEGRPVKQRRKRSRVNPEQLVKLEEIFATDNSPTSSKRKDIAQQLGMDERQTQIWFQNRRAKAKLQLKLKSRTVEKLEPPPESPPELTSGFDADVQGLIHEDEEVTVFPCTDLTIGTWRRMASPQHDLIAYTCESKRSLSWFIRSAGRSFKMDISYDHILETRFANVSPGIGSATFLVDRPPIFYMENTADPNPGEESARFWQLCGDWTEGMQGTTNLRHCLIGPAYQLAALVNSITSSGTSNEIPLYTPTPSVSDAGSSPEVYTRSLHSPIEQMNGSSLVLRRPSSLSSLRMLHHPSLERLRPRTSVPHFHSPLSSTSTPNSPYAPSDGSMSMSPTMLYLDGPGGYDQRQFGMRQSATGTPDQLAHLPLAMPNLPRAQYDYQTASRAESPYDGSEPPTSAASTPGYFDVSSPTHPMNGPWGGAPVGMTGGPGTGGPLYVPQHAPAQERPQEPYYPYPTAVHSHPHAFPPEHGAAPGHGQGGC
ncbi:hypothetical protein L226DRAFT_522832 [Lentinus tigrinus ALCF2SS1-7]|uniref:Homeobox domain-containing protein n=1 Tax=Lentinus tigrinus ALCF2SS1-6 TaxID=1328759 RepID=A0A5C2SB56_9APHY|nr:hypothetical protein L227DRAFT_563015 [Lentinus tigrinus ALCF2SS1-6]RPD75054.1 hypothetical protein L226DRAFT_522832 [Lentinus tigrinus ALCF2SS1-7]